MCEKPIFKKIIDFEEAKQLIEQIRQQRLNTALSLPPKYGCDVNSAAESMQVAKFTKYAGSFLVISVV